MHASYRNPKVPAWAITSCGIMILRASNAGNSYTVDVSETLINLKLETYVKHNVNLQEQPVSKLS